MEAGHCFSALCRLLFFFSSVDSLVFGLPKNETTRPMSQEIDAEPEHDSSESSFLQSQSQKTRDYAPTEDTLEETHQGETFHSTDPGLEETYSTDFVRAVFNSEDSSSEQNKQVQSTLDPISSKHSADIGNDLTVFIGNVSVSRQSTNWKNSSSRRASDFTDFDDNVDSTTSTKTADSRDDIFYSAYITHPSESVDNNSTRSSRSTSTSSIENGSNPETVHVSTNNSSGASVHVKGSTIKPHSTMRPTIWPSQIGRPRRGLITMEMVQKVATVIPIISIVVMTAGIALNVSSVVVFHRLTASVSNSYMKILIVLDTVCLVLNLPMAAIEVVHDNFIFLPIAYHYFTMYLGLICLMGTRHVVFVLTAFMSVHRCVSLSLPVKFSPRNPLNHPNIALCVVFILAFSLSVPSLTFSFHQDWGSNATETTFNQIVISKTQINEEMMLLGILLFRTIPVPLIITSNLALFASLVRHARDTCAAGIDDMGTVRRRANMMRSVKMVLVYSFFFLFLSLPIPIFPIVQALKPEILIWEPSLPGLLKVIFPFLGVISSSANFVVFFAVSSAFRKGFKVLVSNRCCRFGNRMPRPPPSIVRVSTRTSNSCMKTGFTTLWSCLISNPKRL